MKFKQTLLTIVLSLCMVAASLPNIVSADVKPQDRWTDYAAASFDGGSGTEDDPYKEVNSGAACVACQGSQQRSGWQDT